MSRQWGRRRMVLMGVIKVHKELNNGQEIFPITFIRTDIENKTKTYESLTVRFLKNYCLTNV